MHSLVDELRKKWHNLSGTVVPVRNRFFGERITVAGLITGQDLRDTLRERVSPGSRVLFPATMLRRERDLFLDNSTPEQLAEELGMTLVPVENDGRELLDRMLEVLE